MEWLVVIALAAAAGIALKIRQDREREAKQARLERQEQVLAAAERAQSLFEKIQSLKTNTAKANNCEKALAELRKVDHLPETREYITNYDGLVAQLESLKKVLPVIGHIEKAYRHQFKGSDKAEKNALLDALYEIQTHGISDEDFERAQAYPEGTGEIVERKNIERRLRELGWDG
jgi:hypothetical protein